MRAQRHFAECRQELVDTVHPDLFDRDKLQAALRAMVVQTRNTPVLYDNYTIPMQLFLERMWNDGTARAPRQHQTIVHPDWLWREHVNGRLMDIASESLLESRSPDDTWHSALREWQSAFQMRLQNVLDMHPDTLVVTGAREQESHTVCHAPENAVQSWEVEEGTEVGYLTPQYFALALHRFGGLSPQDSLRIHGAEYEHCPTQFAHQILLAKTLGVYIPFPKTEHENAAQELVLLALDCTRATFNSKIRLGLMFDCQAHFVRHDSADDPDLEDRHTLVFPGNAEAIQNGVHQNLLYA